MAYVTVRGQHGHSENSRQKRRYKVIQKIYKIRTGDDPRAAQLLRQLQRLGYPINGIRIEDVLRVEGIGPEQARVLFKLFCNPVAEQVGDVTVLQKENGPVFEVCYQRAITDPELSSLYHATNALGVEGLQWGRLATRYQFSGVDTTTADEITRRFLFNSQVQTIIAPGVEWPTLIPQGQTGGVSEYDISHMNLTEMKQLSKNRRLFFSPKQLLAIQRFY